MSPAPPDPSPEDQLLQDLEKKFNQGKDTIKAQGNALKFVLSGDGTFVDVTFEVQGSSFPIARATSTKRGSAQFWAKQVVVGLTAAYRLNIEERTARLHEDGEQIWIWAAEKATDEGIRGRVDLVFNDKVVATLARLLSDLIG